MFVLVISISFVPSVAASDISASPITEMKTAPTNSTLGDTIPIQPRPFIDATGLVFELPDDFVNASEMSDEEQPIARLQDESSSLDEVNQAMASSSYTLELTPGEYFPYLSIARVTKNMWINHPYSTQTSCDLTFIMSNPDEGYPRYFRVYMDGVSIYNQVHNTKRLAVTIRITVPDGLRQFTFEVQHGAYGKGWALEKAELWTLNQHEDLYVSADLAENELFPLVYISTIDKHVCNIDGYDPVLHLAVESADPYSRWLYVKVNDLQIYQRVIYLSWEVTLDVSSYMSMTDIHKITIIIKSGSYRQWNLVYLGLERSVAKYAPYTLSLGVSMSWTPTTEYLNDFIQGLRNSVQMLWAATEEQMLVTSIDIYFNEVCDMSKYWTWPSHTDMYVNETHTGSPYAWVGAQKFVLPYQWNPPWSSYMAYHAITHEFAHAYAGVLDEYALDPYGNPLPVECGPYYWSGFSIMDIVQSSLWPRPEFCVRTNHDPDHDTPQEQILHQSCWETMKNTYPQMYEPFQTRSPFAGLVAGLYCVITHP